MGEFPGRESNCSILGRLGLRGLVDVDETMLSGHQWSEVRGQSWKQLCRGS